MKRRRRLMLVLGLVVAGVVAFIVWPVEREPEYKGKRLSEWAEIYETSFNPVNGVDDYPPADSAERREAVEAAHQVRDKLLPRALKMIPYEKPKWKRRVEGFMENTLNVRRWCPLWIWGPFYGDRGEDNLVYFEMLGPDASHAIPELVRIMNHAEMARIRERAMYALACIGKEGLPPLIQVLGDPENPDRRRAAYAIAGMKGPDGVASPAVPLLVKYLKDPDANMSSAAATVLGSLALEADIAVPALTNSLQTSDEYFRELVIETLGKFGEKARPALPALIQALSDTNSAMREAATNALQNIAPEVLPVEDRIKPVEDTNER